jgi:adenylate kinase
LFLVIGKRREWIEPSASIPPFQEVGMRSLRTLGCVVALALAFGTTGYGQSADKRFLIVLIGPTGSGKTTQAEFLKKRFGIPTIAVDDLIQANPAALAKNRTAGITPGPPQLSPAIDGLVAEAITRYDLTKGVALDGYPASKDQADHLAALAAKLNLPAPIIIQIDLPDDVARQRLKTRQHADDKPELIEERLKNYHREMDMIRSYYPQANIWSINGDKPVAVVSSTIEAILKDEMPKQH